MRTGLFAGLGSEPREAHALRGHWRPTPSLAAGTASRTSMRGAREECRGWLWDDRGRKALWVDSGPRSEQELDLELC